MFAPSFSLSRADCLANVEDTNQILQSLSWDSPTLIVQDIPKAIQFYEKVFGFQPIFILPNEKNDVTFARMRYRGTCFTLTREDELLCEEQPQIGSDSSLSSSFYLYVDNVNQVYANAIEHGCWSLETPRVDFLGDHRARLRDIFGYIWDIAAKI